MYVIGWSISSGLSIDYKWFVKTSWSWKDIWKMILRWNTLTLRKNQKFKTRKKFILISLIIEQIKVSNFKSNFYWHIIGTVWLIIHLIFMILYGWLILYEWYICDITWVSWVIGYDCFLWKTSTNGWKIVIKHPADKA